MSAEPGVVHGGLHAERYCLERVHTSHASREEVGGSTPSPRAQTRIEAFPGPETYAAQACACTLERSCERHPRTCRCVDGGTVLADRGNATVECACGRCTPRRLAAVEAETARLGRTLLALALVLALGASSARAGEPCRRVVHLDTGALAPCRGDLYPVPEAQRLLDAEDELAAERDRLALLARERAADAALAARLLESERAARRACERAAAPPPARARAFYESPWFGVAVGVLVGSGLALGTVYALRAGE